MYVVVYLSIDTVYRYSFVTNLSFSFFGFTTTQARIVCIVTNSLFGGISLFGLIMIIFDPDFFQEYSPYNIFFKLQGWTSIVVPIINVGFAMIGLVGALRYQSCLVFTVFLWFMFEMVSSVILGLWSGVSMAFVFGLPNANLFCQLKTLESQSTIE